LHLSRGIAGNAVAVVQYDYGIAEPHHELHLVLDNEEGDALRVSSANVALHRLDHDRVDAGSGLVEQDEGGFGHEHAGELE
jgi:hypothetical protein